VIEEMLKFWESCFYFRSISYDGEQTGFSEERILNKNPVFFHSQDFFSLPAQFFFSPDILSALKGEAFCVVKW